MSISLLAQALYDIDELSKTYQSHAGNQKGLEVDKTLSRCYVRTITDKIDSLKKDPRPSGVEPLKGNWKGLYRIRAGNYRVIYMVKDEKLLILVVKVAKRGEVYKP